ncbi:unnamed protein product [Bemisia tabaci]|uniref:Protein disulfide-isomerase n=1 Tax=Bemisia tabaci TaxID=7038 RepID=A0A9P0AFJ2_BEMTA|nr:unnamed protein product [Bemisia tabaci]
MLNFKMYLLALVFAVAFAEEEIKTEENVLVLNKGNFQSALANNEFILVEFFAPWCGHCKELAPQYAKAATVLADEKSNIKLAKVDATIETELAEQHDVKGFPTLKFFIKENAVDYSGGRQADQIISWLKKKTGPPATELKSVSDAKEFIDAHDVSIVGFFKDAESENAKVFLSAASLIDSHPFAITADDSVFSEHKVESDKIVLFKKFDEGRNDFEEEYSVETIKKFIATQGLPSVVEFNHETAQKIFGGDIKSHLLLFLSKKAGHYDTHVKAAEKVAPQFKGQVLFVSINADDEDHQRILEFFGMKPDEVPTMRVIKLEDDMSKYKPAKPDLTEENIRFFVSEFVAGNLKQHLLSQDLPEDWDKNPVKVLVASNFDDVAFDKSKTVLVEFYAPWCGHCKQLAPVYEKLAESFKDKEDIVIAKIDSTLNELEHTKISSFPTLKLYMAGDNKIIEYNGERTLEGLTKFLDTKGEYGQAAPDADTEEEDEDDDLPKKDEL